MATRSQKDLIAFERKASQKFNKTAEPNDLFAMFQDCIENDCLPKDPYFRNLFLNFIKSERQMRNATGENIEMTMMEEWAILVAEKENKEKGYNEEPKPQKPIRIRQKLNKKEE